MWSLEDDHCETRRVPENTTSSLKQSSDSPPQTPRASLQTPPGFIIPGTHEGQDHHSHFSLPVRWTTVKNDTEAATSEHLSLFSSINKDLGTGARNEQSNDHIKSSHDGVNSDILQLWEAIQNAVQSVDDRLKLTTTATAVPSERLVTYESGVPHEYSNPQVARELSVRNFNRPSNVDPITKPNSNSTSPSRKRPSLRKTAINRTKVAIPSDPKKSLYSNAKNASIQQLQILLDSPKLDIVNQDTSEVYVKGVSLHMLVYFCGERVLASRSHSDAILVPPARASEDGIVRVIRYMRRWCLNASVRPTGELRTPPTIKEAIATALACRFLSLEADAQRMEELVVQDLMCNPRLYITDEDVELIWCGYGGALKETPFGDAIIWFILEHVMGGTHALADELRWMLIQEEFEELKARIRSEMKRAVWRSLGRKGFLNWCLKDRERRRTAGELESSGSDGALAQSLRKGNPVRNKPLPRLPKNL